jgi:hypothetical protein
VPREAISDTIERNETALLLKWHVMQLLFSFLFSQIMWVGIIIYYTLLYHPRISMNQR